mmetsp:Transcript_12160/g.18275  ORF Transcript_12160/g.18275 Transcript_12160/m.18275 type:complete len:711 (+) Transcript_12160:2172-4304(+)
MRNIAATRCRYIRCIRPNDAARPMGASKAFDRIAVVDQLRCCGILSALRVSRAGYPDRKPVQQFVERFAICASNPSAILKSCRQISYYGGNNDNASSEGAQAGFENDSLALLDDIESSNENAFDDATLLLDPVAVKLAAPWREAAMNILSTIDDSQLRNKKKLALGLRSQQPNFKIREKAFIGKTKVFLRDHALDELERLRAIAAFDSAAIIQGHIRRYLARCIYILTLKRIIKIQSCLRKFSAMRIVLILRKKYNFAILIQAKCRGYSLRKKGEYRKKRQAIIRLQTLFFRPILAKRRIIRLKEFKAKGRRLDSIQSRLRDLSSKKLSIPQVLSQQSSSTKHASSLSKNLSTQKEEIIEKQNEEEINKVKAEAAATVQAAQEVAHDASKALEELRRENALLRDRCSAAEARAEGYRSLNAKAKQREAQLLAIVDEVRREAKDAHDKRKKAQTSADIANSGSEAALGYSRLRQQMLQATNVTPQLRKRILESRRPNRAITITQQDLLKFKQKMRDDGLDVLKHSTSGRAQRRVLKLTDNFHGLYWENPTISGRKAHRPPAKDSIYSLSECIELRRATDVDPESKSSKLQCGTKILRRSMAAKNAPLAFSFIYPSRTIDIQFSTPEEAKISLRYCKALVQQAKAKALKDLLGSDDDHRDASDDIILPVTPAFASSTGKGTFTKPPHPPSLSNDTEGEFHFGGTTSSNPRSF